jgi:hypothetical protein
MIREASAQREKQEQSIKARKNELFLEEEVEESGPRKRLRDYVKETPAAPLSKNVKLTLWGSAAPVVLLFVLALLARRSHFKPPEETLWRPAAPSYAAHSGGTPPAPGVAKSEGSGPGAAATPPSKPPQNKAKTKKKQQKKSKSKPKPKDETAVAQNTEGDSTKSEKPKDGDQGDQANAENPGEKGNEAKKTGGNATDTKGKSTTSKKPRKQAPSILVKKPKPYNPAYPPRTPLPEKKAESDSDSDPGAGFP